ncbi:uncharacterized protein PADG_11848 [Paracoccidioides brasiliensis Pb18]|uniref:Uncharacterized protein n=1 Tax=Paracoccidioides brasiliensis (strain Pb18) TaxID=502780 RepID=A0A0A0HVI7_PARBD|nr:uncharacterized protein PADG_11848 [Paracoccidioides brasiliensis Pb18]KGM92056.1 hypothetical protein PADG_11848 [Paracoccidioides brasiliensis Pb18]
MLSTSARLGEHDSGAKRLQREGPGTLFTRAELAGVRYLYRLCGGPLGLIGVCLAPLKNELVGLELHPDSVPDSSFQQASKRPDSRFRILDFLPFLARAHGCLAVQFSARSNQASSHDYVTRESSRTRSAAAVVVVSFLVGPHYLTTLALVLLRPQPISPPHLTFPIAHFVVCPPTARAAIPVDCSAHVPMNGPSVCIRF